VLRDERTKYLVAGGMTAIVYFGLFSGAWALLRGVIPYPLVALGAQGITVMLVYPLYRIVVFRPVGPWIWGLLRFYIACTSSFVLSIACLVLLAEITGLPVLFAQFISLVVLSVVVYPVQRYWTFRAHLRNRVERPRKEASRLVHRDPVA
jgi:putative flippase GtrA